MSVTQKYSWFKRVFWLVLLGFIAFMVTAISHRPPAPEPYQTIGNLLFWAVFISSVTYLFLLGSLARYVGKSAALWVIASVLFAPLGIIISFIRMCGFVPNKIAAQQSTPSDVPASQGRG